MPHHRGRLGRHRDRGQAVADYQGNVARRRGSRQDIARGRVELPAEIRPGQIVPPVGGAARHLQGRQAQRLQLGGERRGIEAGMDGVAGAGMGQGEIQQRLGRQAGAGAAERDAGRGQTAQLGQRARRGGG